MTDDHLPPTDHDGTAIAWDSERITSALPPLSAEMKLFGFALGVAVVGAVGFALWCAWGEP